MGIPFFCLHYSESEKLPLYNGEESCSEYDNIQQENDIADDGLQEKLEEERKLSCFYRAVKQLPGAKREICLLKIYEGLNNQEIAHRLNIPVGTVKNYYTQSIQLLKYYLKELY